MGIKKTIALLDELKYFLSEAYKMDPSSPWITKIHNMLPKEEEMMGIKLSIMEQKLMINTLNFFQEGKFGVISSYKKGLKSKENIERQYQLFMEIKKLGYGYIPIIARWDRLPKHSIFVVGISREKIKELAIKYEQERYISGENKNWALYETVSDKELKKMYPINPYFFDCCFEYFCGARYLNLEIPEYINGCYKLIEKNMEKWKIYIQHKLDELKEGDIVFINTRKTGVYLFTFKTGYLYLYLGNGEFVKLRDDLLDSEMRKQIKDPAESVRDMVGRFWEDTYTMLPSFIYHIFFLERMGLVRGGVQ